MNAWCSHLGAALALAALLSPSLAFAHGGEDHDHGAPAVAPPTLSAAEPRFEAATADIELLAVLREGRLIVYLDRYVTNEPLSGARIALESGTHQFSATPAGAGTYTLPAGALSAPGRHELVFTVETEGLSDVVIGTLEVPQPVSAEASGSSLSYDDIPWVEAGTAVVVVLLALGLMRGRRRTRCAPAVAVLTALLLGVPDIEAHEGEDHASPPAAPLPAAQAQDAPRRLPDGRVFMPKPAQRLLGIRTVPAEAAEIPGSVQLSGHVIADPNYSGRVQAAQAGRLEPGAEGLPHLGQRVRQGQVLAYLSPLVSSLETGNQQAQLAALASQIAVAERRLQRLEQLAGSVSRKERDEARAELEGLRKRRAALSASTEREALRAPVDGVISRANAVAGQVVEAREVLFEILDPARLWVEATVYDLTLVGQVAVASAVPLDGQALPLAFVGAGYQLRGQGLPMQFRLEPPLPPLNVGQPVKVLVQTRAHVHGIPLPQASIVRGTGGESLVWVHESAERFRPQRVEVQAVDGRTVAVLQGLKAGERVVTVGAALLAQVR